MRGSFCCECRASPWTSDLRLCLRRAHSRRKASAGRRSSRLASRRPCIPSFVPARSDTWRPTVLAHQFPGVHPQTEPGKSPMVRTPVTGPRGCSESKAGHAIGLLVAPASLTLCPGVPNPYQGEDNESKKVARGSISFDSGSYRGCRREFRIGTESFDQYDRRWHQASSPGPLELNAREKRSKARAAGRNSGFSPPMLAWPPRRHAGTYLLVGRQPA